MADCKFIPEGISGEPRKYTVDELNDLIESGETVEGLVVRCDEKQNLIVDLGRGITGVIPFGESEVSYDGEIKKISIISKVGKVISFKVKEIHRAGPRYKVKLSRKEAQAEYLDFIKRAAHCGDVLTARVSNVETFGAFVDIGCGVTALLPSDKISISRVNSAKLALKTGMKIKVILKSVDQNGRITVSHKELLGTWLENVEEFGFKPGETVVGRARAKTDYGIFIELAPNLSGLAEIQEGITENDPVTVYIKNIIPDKMKIKLSILDKAETPSKHPDFHYFIKEGHVDHWVYTPEGAKRVIETYFDDAAKHIGDEVEQPEQAERTEQGEPGQAKEIEAPESDVE